MVKKILLTAALALLASTAWAEHAYIDFDGDGNMIVSGPFNAKIPQPGGATKAGPAHDHEKFLTENLAISVAGYYGTDQFVTVRVETTDAPAGTLTNDNLPTMAIAGQDFRARRGCIDISQDDIDAADDPLITFMDEAGVQMVPALHAVQLFVNNGDGTAEGVVLYMRNAPDGCDGIDAEFKAEFDRAFDAFVGSITAN